MKFKPIIEEIRNELDCSSLNNRDLIFTRFYLNYLDEVADFLDKKNDLLEKSEKEKNSRTINNYTFPKEIFSKIRRIKK